MRAYREEAHIGILSSTSYPMLQSALRSQGIERRMLLELPGFLGLASIVSSTDLVATVPRTIGEAVARMGAIRVLACPVRVPTFMVSQYWHARYHHDPGVRWLRGVCQKRGPAGRRPRTVNGEGRGALGSRPVGFLLNCSAASTAETFGSLLRLPSARM